MPDQPEPSAVESGPVTLQAVPGATPMEQKKNLEESGIPTTPVSAVQDSTTSDAPVVAPVQDQTSTDDDGTFVSLEELKAMSEEDLRQFCKDNELVPPVEADNQQDLLDWLLSEFGVDA